MAVVCQWPSTPSYFNILLLLQNRKVHQSSSSSSMVALEAYPRLNLFLRKHPVLLVSSPIFINCTRGVRLNGKMICECWTGKHTKGCDRGFFYVLFSTLLQRWKIAKTHQDYQCMAQDSKPTVVFFPHALRLNSSTSASATLIFDCATKTGFTLGMLDPPPTKRWGTRAARQVGPAAWHNMATKTLLFGESSFGQARNY
jgi:hypothetical protein